MALAHGAARPSGRIALHRQPGWLRAVDRRVGSLTTPRRGVLPGRGRPRARLAGVAPEGRRLRGSDADGRPAGHAGACATRIRPEGVALRGAVLARVAHRDLRRGAGLGCAGAVRLPARRVLEPAVVGVRGTAGRAEVPARDSGRAGGHARPGAAPAPAPPATPSPG